jgi:tetratricopeptide (TPR) repeat protein
LGLGSANWHLKNTDAVLEHYKKAVEILENVVQRVPKAKEKLATAYHFVGFAYDDVQDKTNAVKNYKEALRIYEQLDQPKGTHKKTIDELKKNIERLK